MSISRASVAAGSSSSRLGVIGAWSEMPLVLGVAFGGEHVREDLSNDRATGVVETNFDAPVPATHEELPGH